MNTIELSASHAAKLEPFLLMAKSAKGAAAAKLIENATSAPGVFVFSELLDIQSIQELSNIPQHASHLALLELFAYKTYADYAQNKDAFPPLNLSQLTKLRYLSIVSLSSRQRILPYSDLMTALDISSVRELEDLIIDAIYLDVLRGRLDQKQSQLEVEYTIGRDVPHDDVQRLLNDLTSWSQTTASVLSALDDKLASLTVESARVAAEKDAHEQAYSSTLKEALERSRNERDRDRMGFGGATGERGGRKLGSMVRGDDSMDVDDDAAGPRTRRKTTDPMRARMGKRNRF